MVFLLVQVGYKDRSFHRWRMLPSMVFLLLPLQFICVLWNIANFLLSSLQQMFLLNKQRTSSLFKHHLNKYSVNLPTTIQCPHSNKRSVKLHSKDKLHQMEVCFHRFQTVGKRNNGRGNAKRWSRFVNSKRRWRRNVLFENNSNVLKKSSSGSTFKIVVVSPSLLFFLVS